jgi:hypothetical protein
MGISAYSWPNHIVSFDIDWIVKLDCFIDNKKLIIFYKIGTFGLEFSLTVECVTHGQIT